MLIKTKLLFFINLIFLVSTLLISCSHIESNIVQVSEIDCHPNPILSKAQYIVGYGSLMNEVSKRRTTKNVGENLPVRLSEYKRVWNARGSVVGFSTTYLGVTPDKDSKINAVIYQLFEKSDIFKTDQRELSYCRKKIHPNQIEILNHSEILEGEIWIYVNNQETSYLPSKTYPILQSYVDIFLNGCLQIEEKFKLNGFAKECIHSTHGWSHHWVNDRLYPRRPFIYQQNARNIDQLLEKELPTYFRNIRIE